MADLWSLGGYGGEALDINDRAHVVGQSGTTAGPNHGFLWQDGVMTDFGTLGGSDSRAVDINDRCMAVGMSLTASGGQHAVLWTSSR